MEEIKVYHSVWKRLPVILIGFAFSAWAVFALWQGRGQSWKSWLCLLLSGVGSLLYLYLTLKERWSDKPYLTVTGKSLIVNNGYVFGRGWYMSEIDLADVELFELMPRSILHKRGPRLRIHYKGRMEEKYPTDLVGQIPVGDIDMKPQLLCDLLNEQLRS